MFAMLKDVQALMVLYWWQSLIIFGCSSVMINETNALHGYAPVERLFS